MYHIIVENKKDIEVLSVTYRVVANETIVVYIKSEKLDTGKRRLTIEEYNIAYGELEHPKYLDYVRINTRCLQYSKTVDFTTTTVDHIKWWLISPEGREHAIAVVDDVPDEELQIEMFSFGHILEVVEKYDQSNRMRNVVAI